MVELGQTPVELTTSQLQEKVKIENNSSQYRELVIKMDGYTSQVLMLPPARFTTLKTEVFAKLDKTPEDEKTKAERMVQHLFNAQKFAQNLDYERAHREVDMALAISPEFVRAISMQGTLFFLQGKYVDSLKWFERAIEIEPEFSDAIKMIAAVKEKLNKGEPGK